MYLPDPKYIFQRSPDVAPDASVKTLSVVVVIVVARHPVALLFHCSRNRVKVSRNATSLSTGRERKERKELSTYSVYRCRHPPYRKGTTAVVYDGVCGADGVSSLPVDARPRTPCAPCDLEADERDVSASQPSRCGQFI